MALSLHAVSPIPSLHSVVVAETCTKTTTAGTIGGLVFLLAIVAVIVFFAVANARARRNLAAANTELGYLRPQNARLQLWLDGLSGVVVQSAADGGTYQSTSVVPPQWYADPSRRHELRRWDGSQWTDEVSDQGVLSRDAPN
jgi:hypothetical protein